MLQISNIDDGKSEWNINETHMIIPMIDGDVTTKEPDKILTNALTLNTLEGGDQTILTNALEHSLVIGLDKNLFDAPNYKSDLVIIQNSDLKLLSCGTDLKNPVTYTLSYVDQDKSEILWTNPKDRICGNEKAILEVRDVLNYDELEKTEEQINLECIESDISSQTITKTGSEILTRETVVEEKKESQFITYYSQVENGETGSILPHLDASKFIENIKSIDSCSESNISSTYKLGKDVQKNSLSVTKPVLEINDSVPIKLVEYVKQKTDKKQKTKDESNKGEELDEGFSHFLPEKSLPLKKKAKMKRTLLLVSSDNQRSLLKQDLPASSQANVKFSAERKIKKPQTPSEEQNELNSDSDEPLINKVGKRKKTTKLKTNPKKSHKSISSIEEEENESKPHTNNSIGERRTTKHNFYGFDKDKFSNIYDLVECLRKCRVINTTVWQTLNSGLKEMNVDILKEMNSKINESHSQEKIQYSAQLKAFALVLYFKQPAAFTHLAKEYKTGWPSLNVIKEWKRQMNSHHLRRERH